MLSQIELMLRRHRLKSEMDHLLVQNRFQALHTLTYKFHNPPIHENSVAWLGGEASAGSIGIVGYTIVCLLFAQGRYLAPQMLQYRSED